ncbi:Fe-S cluster assembly protein HesB [Nocardioides speluncae]|uniref:Fe-S cluster assembly protein HesB n=1 Tax=Nocardioides speluncae TaxID=2670337 RepID=UPI000D69F2CA|nr:Fe-S cluster assembly protein HesB [Nocardioides speluncae]
MLTLTENASTIVKDIATRSAIETAGLRITSEGAPEPAFSVVTAEQPEPGDQVVEQDGATVYLDGVAAGQLDDKVLDATLDQGGKVQFSLLTQP